MIRLSSLFSRRKLSGSLVSLLLVVMLQLAASGKVYATGEPPGVNITIDRKIFLLPVDESDAPEHSDGSCGITNQRAQGFITAYVDFVYDGDSLKLKNGKEVRIIGINAPERGEPLAEAAKAGLLQQVGGGEVYLQLGAEWEDNYDRLLAHLWEKRGPAWVNLQEELLRQGLAYHIAIAPNFANLACYQRAEAYARANRLGIWADFAPTPADRVARTGFAAVQGKVTRIKHQGSAGSELLLAGRKMHLWVPQSAYEYFGGRRALRTLAGREVIATGWIYKRRDSQRLQMSISHPTMLKYN